MNETTVNIPLLRKAVEWAEAEAAKPPELCEWEQADVVTEPSDFVLFEMNKAPECGTCYCIAGYVAALVVGERAVAESEVSAISVAEDALGIRGRDHRLFIYNNTIEDVRRIAESLAGERL